MNSKPMSSLLILLVILTTDSFDFCSVFVLFCALTLTIPATKTAIVNITFFMISKLNCYLETPLWNSFSSGEKGCDYFKNYL